jgi:hypothetical protein
MDKSNEIEVTQIYEADAASMSALTLSLFKSAEIRVTQGLANQIDGASQAIGALPHVSYVHVIMSAQSANRVRSKPQSLALASDLIPAYGSRGT